VNEKIGELLVKENLLTAEQLNNARDEARAKSARLGAQITALGYLDENELTDFVAKQYGVPSINLEEFEIDPAVIQLIPEDVAIKHTRSIQHLRTRRHQVSHRLQHPAGGGRGRSHPAGRRQALRPIVFPR
jgi:hypothetical protein